MKDHPSHLSQLHRLKRIEGQIRGVRSMVEEGRYCVDILTQIKAIRSALSSFETKVLEEHLDHCLSQAFQTKNKKESDKILNEIKALMKKTWK